MKINTRKRIRKSNIQANSREKVAKLEKILKEKLPEEALTIDKKAKENFDESPYRWYVIIAYFLCVFATDFNE